MGIPGFLVRKLYKRGSLRETADGRFAFTIHNPLGTASIITPPTFTINGIRHAPDEIETQSPMADITADSPLVFAKGDAIDLVFNGRLLRGANRIHMVAETKEYGVLEMFVEEQEADYCDMPGAVVDEK